MRKHLFFLAPFLFLTVALNAQIIKGATFFGGDIGFSSQKTTSSSNVNSEQRGIGILPVFGKAVKNNLIIGADANITFSKSDFVGDANDRKERSLGVGVFIRKYKQLGDGGFSLFLQGRLGGDYYKSDLGYNSPAPDELKQYVIAVSLYPGVSYAISKRLQLETGFNNLMRLTYIHGKGKINSPVPVTYHTNSFYISSSLENLSYLYVGFRLLINK